MNKDRWCKNSKITSLPEMEEVMNLRAVHGLKDAATRALKNKMACSNGCCDAVQLERSFNVVIVCALVNHQAAVLMQKQYAD